MSYLQIALQIIIGAIVAFAVLRLMGRKAISDLTPFDLLFTLVLGDTIIEPVYDPDVTLGHQLLGIIVWGIFVYVFQIILEKWERPSKIIEGEPDLIIKSGRINIPALERNKMNMEQVRKLLRQEGYYSIRDIHHAILEVNGDVTVVSKEKKDSFSVLVIVDGKVDESVVKKTLGQTPAWVVEHVTQAGYDVSDIYYAEYFEDDTFNIVTYDDLSLAGKQPIDE